MNRRVFAGQIAMLADRPADTIQNMVGVGFNDYLNTATSKPREIHPYTRLPRRM